MGQKILNIVLLVGLIAVSSFSYYLYNQNQNITSELLRYANKPFELPGEGLDSYDMTNPEAYLRSMKEMISSFDLKAGFDYVKLAMLNDGGDPKAEFFFTDNSQVSVKKTHVISNTSAEGKEGVIIAFEQIIVNGVTHNDISFYERVNGILVESYFYLPEYNQEEWTEEDSYLFEAMNAWRTSGRLI